MPPGQPGGEPTARPVPARKVHVAVAGDVLLHNGLWQTAVADARRTGRPGAMDFRPMFRPVRRVLSQADLAVCHLETPLAQPGGPFRDYPLFAVPPQVVDGLRHAGFDACTTASNHSLDQGHEGLVRTLRVLDRHGLAHAGTERSPAEARAPTVLDVKGVRVALLSYTYGTNGIPLARSRAWSVKLISPWRIREDARRARLAGADAVLVALHWGTEYTHEPTAYQQQVARLVTRSPHVDLVFGHHAHVVQPVRQVNGTWVAYGLGNFVAQQDPATPGVYEGMVARFVLVRDRSGRVSVRYAGYRPTYISHHDVSAMRVYDAVSALRRRWVAGWLRAEIAEARSRVSRVAGPGAG